MSNDLFFISIISSFFLAFVVYAIIMNNREINNLKKEVLKEINKKHRKEKNQLEMKRFEYYQRTEDYEQFESELEMICNINKIDID